jgi:co-chaperonin GroES (HSP10)
MIYQPEEIEVFHDLVLVRRIDTAKTPGGIWMPHHPDKKESNLAKVVKVGGGVIGKPETVPQCKPGEYWLVARYIGTVITLNGKDHILVKWNDMQARIRFSDEAIELLDDALEDCDKDRAGAQAAERLGLS